MELKQFKSNYIYNNRNFPITPPYSYDYQINNSSLLLNNINTNTSAIISDFEDKIPISLLLPLEEHHHHHQHQQHQYLCLPSPPLTPPKQEETQFKLELDKNNNIIESSIKDQSSYLSTSSITTTTLSKIIPSSFGIQNILGNNNNFIKGQTNNIIATTSSPIRTKSVIMKVDPDQIITEIKPRTLLLESNHTDFICHWINCYKVFESLESLASHVTQMHAIATTEGLYYCKWMSCTRSDRGFNARYKMLVHVRTHTKEKPHKCHLCIKSFSRAENLKIHLRSHSGEKPYVCPYEGCNKAYSNSSDRFKHTKTHATQKPYGCKIPGCQKRYTDPSSLRKHVKTFKHNQIIVSQDINNHNQQPQQDHQQIIQRVIEEEQQQQKTDSLSALNKTATTDNITSFGQYSPPASVSSIIDVTTDNNRIQFPLNVCNTPISEYSLCKDQILMDDSMSSSCHFSNDTTNYYDTRTNKEYFKFNNFCYNQPLELTKRTSLISQEFPSPTTPTSALHYWNGHDQCNDDIILRSNFDYKPIDDEPMNVDVPLDLRTHHR